jgi:hypothetical protein
MFAASWTCWLALLTAGGGLVALRVERHRDDLSLLQATWKLRYGLCKRLSQAPRPTWRECVVRTQQSVHTDLLAAARPDFRRTD